MKKCYLVGAGDMHQGFTPAPDSFVIAADGGYKHLLNFGITPNLFVGDGDSLGSFPDSVECIRHKVQKDETDMHLAYLEGRRRGYQSFELYGGTGGRIDHTLANFSLLLYAKKLGDNIEIFADTWRAVMILNESITLPCHEGKNLSVFAYGDTAEGVSVKGALYEAENITLKNDFALGVSNSFLSSDVTISVSSGALLIIYEV